jgi:hypothetical protein
LICKSSGIGWAEMDRRSFLRALLATTALAEPLPFGLPIPAAAGGLASRPPGGAKAWAQITLKGVMGAYNVSRVESRGLGEYTVHFARGIFPAPPATMVDAGAGNFASVQEQSASAIRIRVMDSECSPASADRVAVVAFGL